MEEDQEDEATANCKQRLWLRRLVWTQKPRRYQKWMEISHLKGKQTNTANCPAGFSTMGSGWPTLTGVPLHTAVHSGSPPGSMTHGRHHAVTDLIGSLACDADGDLPRVSFPSHSACAELSSRRRSDEANKQPITSQPNHMDAAHCLLTGWSP